MTSNRLGAFVPDETRDSKCLVRELKKKGGGGGVCERTTACRAAKVRRATARLGSGACSWSDIDAAAVWWSRTKNKNPERKKKVKSVCMYMGGEWLAIERLSGASTCCIATLCWNNV